MYSVYERYLHKVKMFSHRLVGCEHKFLYYIMGNASLCSFYIYGGAGFIDFYFSFRQVKVDAAALLSFFGEQRREVSHIHDCAVKMRVNFLVFYKITFYYL